VIITQKEVAQLPRILSSPDLAGGTVHNGERPVAEQPTVSHFRGVHLLSIIDFTGYRHSATTELAHVCPAAEGVASVCITGSYGSSIVQISGSGPSGSGVNML
jgi:hypothetical protein